jgi:Fibronectin type III domain
VNHTNRFRPPRRRGELALMLLIPIVALLASCTGQNSTSGPAVPTVSAATGARCADFAAGVPQAVTNTQGTDTSTVDVTWQLPTPGCAQATRYDIVQIASDGSPDGVVQTVPASTLSVTVTGLNVCTYYRFGVEAASSGGFVSAIGLPPYPAYTYGPPTNANIVTIVVQGLDSHVSSASWTPLATPVCTSSQGAWPLDHGQDSPPFPPSLHDLIYAWLNLDDNQRLQHMPAGIGAGNNLIDSLGAAGGIVLPYSYNPGASLDLATRNFTFPGYTATDVNTSDPTTSFNMENEIKSVHTALPDAKIFVVGHSNGGLVAEQWWWNFGQYHPEGVVQVISLDSPLNGIYDGAFCNNEKGPCGVDLGKAYWDLWNNQNTLDPQKVTVDNADKLFTAVGTFGDPVYDVADNGATNIPTDARIGIVSQLFYTEPSCKSGFNPLDLNTNRCQPAGQYFIDPCSSKGSPLDNEWGPPVIPPGFGAPGSLWMHSVVKNCPGVITEIMSFYPRSTPPPAPTGQSTSTPPPPPPSTSTPSAPPTGCPGVTYFDARPGDQCSSSGGTLNQGNQGGWTITVGALTPSLDDTGRPQLCSQVTAIKRGSEVGLMAGVFWSIETDPPGSAAPTTAGTIGGTMQQNGYIQPGGTAQGTFCFADVGHPGQILVVYSAPGGDRSLWISNR